MKHVVLVLVVGVLGACGDNAPGAESGSDSGPTARDQGVGPQDIGAEQPSDAAPDRTSDQGAAEDTTPLDSLASYEVMAVCPETFDDSNDYAFSAADFNELNVFCRYEPADSTESPVRYKYRNSGFPNFDGHYYPSCRVEGRTIICLPDAAVETECAGEAFALCTVLNGKSDSGTKRRTCTAGQWGPPYGVCVMGIGAANCREEYLPASDRRSCCLGPVGEEPCTVENGKDDSGVLELTCSGGAWVPGWSEKCEVSSENDCEEGYEPSDDKKRCVELEGTGALFIAADGSLRFVSGRVAFDDEAIEVSGFLDDAEAARLGVSDIMCGTANAMHAQVTKSRVIDLFFDYGGDTYVFNFDSANNVVWAYNFSNGWESLGGNRLFGSSGIGSEYANTTALFETLFRAWPNAFGD